MAQSSSTYNGAGNDGETSLVKDDEVQQLATSLEQKQNDESKIIETTMRPRRIIDTIIHNLIPTLPPSPEYEIASSDVIEIEVPIIGSEFIKRRDQVDAPRQEEIVSKVAAGDIKSERDEQPLTPPSTAAFQPSSVNVAEVTAATTPPTVTKHFERDYHEKIPAFVDEDGRIFAIKKPSKLKIHANGLLPLSIKIYVDTVDEKKSCKTKTSCRQVNFAGASKVEQQQQREHDIDLQFYTEYSDEDLVFNDYRSSNGLRSRNAKRAAMPGDDSVVTPAPRMPVIPGIPGLPAFRKPAILERLENESSMERAERINNDLDSLMKFVAVWAHVDKFVSERVRSTVKKLSYLANDGDYDDGAFVGSARRRASKKTDLDDPFT